MPKASELKRGIAVEYNGKLLLVKHVELMGKLMGKLMVTRLSLLYYV